MIYGISHTTFFRKVLNITYVEIFQIEQWAQLDQSTDIYTFSMTTEALVENVPDWSS